MGSQESKNATETLIDSIDKHLMSIIDECINPKHERKSISDEEKQIIKKGQELKKILKEDT